ncbi:hypothetical protein BDZ45DRAFT_673641 [Acephala macrosclerotiorum]|nr:hypothetical protein BDZ45DRAFT_673641 [Acephala macrosclerotiorum]
MMFYRTESRRDKGGSEYGFDGLILEVDVNYFWDLENNVTSFVIFIFAKFAMLPLFRNIGLHVIVTESIGGS